MRNFVWIAILGVSLWGCGENRKENKEETYTEAADPYPAHDSVWVPVPDGVHAAFVSVDERFPRSAPPAPGQTQQQWRAKAWRGERVHTQALIWSADSVPGVQLTTDALKNGSSTIGSDQIRANFVRYVITDHLGDLQKGCGIPDNLDTSLVADVIDDIRQFDIPSKTSRPVWLSIDVPADAAPGHYSGVLQITSAGEKIAELPYQVEVLPYTLPEPKDWAFHLDLWQNPFSTSRYHEVPVWSDQHLEAMRPEMVRLAQAGQKVITASIIHDPWNSQTYDIYQTMVRWVKKSDGTWTYDYTVFDKWVTYMMDLGIDKYINCYSMIPWNLKFYYHDEALGRDTLIVAQPGTAEYREHWQPMLTDFARHLKEKGWWEKTMIAMDERPMDHMLQAIEIIKAADPDFRVSLAGTFHPELADVLLDYCIASAEKMDEQTLQRRKQNGLNTTFYTCCMEARPNTFTSSPYAEATWLSWHAVHKGYDGYLRWAYNCWNAEPFQDTRFSKWAAGDTWLVYPGNRTSIRFERLREGIQDYEKARHIRSKLKEHGRDADLARLDEAIARFELDALNTTPAATAVNEAKAVLNSF